MLVDRPETLREVAIELAREPVLGLDVEGDGLFRFRARLCTVQLATASRALVVDTLAIAPPVLRETLGPLLAESGPRKVLHDAAFDARLLREAGLPLGNVFDTAVAVRFLGEKAIGLAAVIRARFGIELPKEQQQADWGKRPLDEDALIYLYDDVRHLIPLAERIAAEIAERGIAAEVEEETRYVLARAAEEPPEPLPAWMRIKGSLELGPAVQAILREVAEVREAAARRWDVPPFKVIGNDALIAMSQRRPRGPADLAKIPGAAAGRARAIGGELLAAITRGERAGAPPAEELARVRRAPLPPDERQLRRDREQKLSAWRRTTAEARKVDPQVVLPGHVLSDLAARGAATLDDLRAIPGLGELRVTRDGPTLLTLLAVSRGEAGQAP